MLHSIKMKINLESEEWVDLANHSLFRLSECVSETDSFT